MAAKPTKPLTEVAITLIRRGAKKDQILAHYSPNWDAFTLPMTKRRKYFDPDVDSEARLEDWLDAAARAASEVLGRTCSPTALLEDFLPEHEQSGRDGKWRLYRFRVFEVVLRDGESLPAGQTVEWLTTDQFLDPNRRPISPTARHVIRYLMAEQVLGTAK
jgi:hypothetical protein